MIRLSNKRKAPVYNFFNILLWMLLAGGCIGFIVDKIRFNILDEKSCFLIIVPIVLLIVIYIHGKQIFEYDSEGEAVHFRNRSITSFLNKPQSDEFPKYKLVKFEMFSFLFFRRLYVTILSKNSGTTTLTYEISYLTRKQVSDLKTSLNKIIRANKEKRHQE
ncbi:hypothetical protein LPB85_07410 [Chryseobacterium sp. LC2016-27]|uniref:hypothetical protein n=1 Tax=Chryseobacterium sp. LC2016-27 TaxID=2897326 RepID=UPI001E5896C3|nr:hypothetical protein [Chryseobacterium sp. LC2016-27]MCD0455278.1 hypothetical protein [Chryseobacterium sp. LC2016-27]